MAVEPIVNRPLNTHVYYLGIAMSNETRFRSAINYVMQNPQFNILPKDNTWNFLKDLKQEQNAQVAFNTVFNGFTHQLENYQDKNAPCYSLALTVHAQIKKIAKQQEKYGDGWHPEVYYQLAEVALRSRLVLMNLMDEQNTKRLLELAQVTAGHSNMAWKSLSVMLFVASVFAMMAGLAFVWPVSSPLLVTLIGYLGMSAIATVVSSLVTSTVVAGTAATGLSVSAFAGIFGIGGAMVGSTLSVSFYKNARLSKAVHDLHDEIKKPQP